MTEQETIERAITHETIDGKWWLFSMGVPVRPLSDVEAADVIWGSEQFTVESSAEAIRNFNRALQVGRSVMAEMKVDDD